MISYNSKFTFGKKYILNILAERFGSDPAKPEEKIGEKPSSAKTHILLQTLSSRPKKYLELKLKPPHLHE